MSEDEDLDLLSAIWILSANDENSLITYRGIVSRLGVSDEQHVRKLVRSRRDLFRLRVLASRLEAWKDDMKKGHHVPVWISEFPNKTSRLAEINKLTIDDVFRNQFRIEDRAKKCDLKTIDWGLQYIERMRAAKAKLREERRTRISTYLSVGSVFVAFLTLSVSAWFQHENMLAQSHTLDAQTELKKYEVTFKPKQESYFGFMSAVEDAFVGAELRNFQRTGDAITRMETMLYAMEPFLTDNQRFEFGGVFTQYITLCNSEMRLPPSTDADRNSDGHKEAMTKFALYKKYFRTQLYSALFSK